MKRLQIDSIASLDALVGALQRNARCRGTRAALLLSGAPASNGAALAGWVRRSRFARSISAGEHSIDASDRILATLGRENGDLYWSAPSGVRPSEIAAVLGTLRAGSLAIIWLPTAALRRSPTLRRLLLQSRRVMRPASRSLGANRTILAATLGNRFDHDTRRARAIRLDRGRGSGLGVAARPAPIEAVRSQNADLARALAHLRSGASPCVVIIGPRGTGKSRLLGRIATALSAGNDRRDRGRGSLGICSAAAAPAIALLLEAPTVRQLSVQKALAEYGDTLLIDEAASLPLATLTTLLQRYERLVLATTVDGYEAAGHAFAGRFLERLGRLRPAWYRLGTTSHFRFPANDPISRLLSESFLLDAHQDDAQIKALDSTGHVILQTPTPDDLARHARLLRRIVALLTQSHYRSALDDLDGLLRGSLATVVARDGEQVVGVVVVAHEGALPPALGEPVLAGLRRLPDQLLPQRLARCANDASALGERYQRVIRIVVAPQRRREGVARRLIEHLIRDAGPHVALGASFARGETADRFWASLGAEVFHDGVRVNPRSGERSRAVLIGGSSGTRQVLQLAVDIHRDNASPAREASDVVRDASLLHRFVVGQRGWRDCRGALSRSWYQLTPDDAPALEDSRAFLGLPESASERHWQRALAAWFSRVEPR